MVTLVRTVVALPGQYFAALALAMEIAEVVKGVTNRDIAVGTRFGGGTEEIAWIVKYDSVVNVEEDATKLTADPGFQDALKKWENVVVPGTLRDQIWRRV